MWVLRPFLPFYALLLAALMLQQLAFDLLGGGDSRDMVLDIGLGIIVYPIVALLGAVAFHLAWRLSRHTYSYVFLTVSALFCAGLFDIGSILVQELKAQGLLALLLLFGSVALAGFACGLRGAVRDAMTRDTES